ncbi:diguanylate cyclase [Vogesella sp. LIG4]|uniref:GGDEF domain-containing protein n=1 Tax=Vogesella sp. LIG4 TaxID=1192162 RepID=UPI00081FF0EF|nr:sensor domain-containing diguanylate cyclase [Vogesella sp. LIG4]SCK22539.1 diguanylate cyclase (GGDEF) domain-containing protein [Vogesella sp. LIG4]
MAGDDPEKSPASGKLLQRHPALILAFAVLLVGVMLGLVGNVLLRQRQEMVLHAADNAENLALISEREITRTLQLFDLSIQAVVDGVVNKEVLALSPGMRQMVLFDRSATAGKYLGSLLFVDDHGNIVFDSAAETPRHGNFVDRPWFTAHLHNADAGLYISPPYRSRLRNGMQSIALSRRVQHADGSLAGVVVGAIDLEYFRALFSGLNLGGDGTINLMSGSGTVIMRLPYRDDWIGANLANSTNFLRARQQHERFFVGTSALDGRTRLYVVRTFKTLPLVISVAQGLDEVYAQWWRQARMVVLLISLLAVSLLAAAWLLTREFQSRLKAERELLLLAEVDGLTALNNRRKFDALFEREWLRAKRLHHPVAALFVDIDWFKGFNDSYGHQRGDDVLRQVAHVIAGAPKRPADVSARFGGEEFVLVLPDTNARGAAKVAQRIVDEVRALQIPHAGSSYGCVTVSVGYACSDMGVIEDGKALIAQADRALYLAKSRGRNRAVSALES